MISPLRISLAAVLLAGTVAAQTTSPDKIHYKFLKGTGTSVINFAPGGPAMGTIMGTATTQWVTGKSNNALAGSPNNSATNNYVDTGWDGAFKDDFTAAWFMKQNSSPGTGLSYVFSGVGSFRCFTNGVAAKGLWTRAWGGSPSDLKTSTDVQALSATAWTHIALVVDWTGTKTATYYINGKPEAPIALTAGANVAASTNKFRVGQHTSTTSSWAYDTDEFRFSNRAATPGEIAAWAAETPAGDNTYNNLAACTANLGSNNGPPSVPNAKYSLQVNQTMKAATVISLGASRTTFVIDLGVLWPSAKGCTFASSLDFIVPGATGAPIPLPIPNISTLKGANLWCQAITLATNVAGSNGFNIFMN